MCASALGEVWAAADAPSAVGDGPRGDEGGDCTPIAADGDGVATGVGVRNTSRATNTPMMIATTAPALRACDGSRYLRRRPRGRILRSPVVVHIWPACLVATSTMTSLVAGAGGSVRGEGPL